MRNKVQAHIKMKYKFVTLCTNMACVGDRGLGGGGGSVPCDGFQVAESEYTLYLK
jgi:hypothetical protein